MYAAVVIGSLLYFCLAKMIFRNSVQKTVDFLKKTSGPFINRDLEEVYLWIDHVGEEEKGVIGVGFSFRLRREKPPADREIPKERESHRVVSCRIGETYISETEYHHALFQHLTVNGNLKRLREFISNETSLKVKDRMLAIRREFDNHD